MAHHYRKDIDEAMEWCNQCNRLTRHKVSDGRRQHCLEHGPKVNERGENKKQEQTRLKREHEQQNPKFF